MTSGVLAAHPSAAHHQTSAAVHFRAGVGPMEVATMGKVLVAAKIQNLADLWELY